jgi:hypothetical protein
LIGRTTLCIFASYFFSFVIGGAAGSAGERDVQWSLLLIMNRTKVDQRIAIAHLSLSLFCLFVF